MSSLFTKVYFANFFFIGLPEWKDLVLISGTVFNQAIAWRPADTNEDGGIIKPLHYFVGHNGVIFVVKYNSKYSLLLTASDDRCIRLWRCDLENLGNHTDKECLCVAYGHENRIWDAVFYSADEEIGGAEYVISTAEDGFCIVWLIDNPSSCKITMSIVKKLNLYSNSLSVSVQLNCSYIAVGSIDGQVRVFQFSDIIHNTNIQQPNIPDGLSDLYGAVKSVALVGNAQ